MTFSRSLSARWLLLLMVCVALLSVPLVADNLKLERGRMEDILDVVAKDVQKDFYDPKLKGLDWKALTDRAHQRIRQSTTLSEMVTAIFALVNTLEDSHTVFIPPGRTQRVSYGFKAKTYGEEILVYEVDKNGPAVKAGLEVGDRIIGVNDFKAERKTWQTMKLFFERLSPFEYMDLIISRGNQAENPDSGKGRGQTCAG